MNLKQYIFWGNARLGRSTFWLLELQQKWGLALVLSCTVSSAGKVETSI